MKVPRRGPGVVNPKGSRSERHLLDCALTLFSTKGYSATSVRDLIELAGVTQPVLYYYFASKEDLFRRLVLELHHAAHPELDQLPERPGGCEEKLRAILQGSFAFCRVDPRVPRLMFQTAYGPSIDRVSTFIAELGRRRFEAVRRVIEQGLGRGELRGGDAAGLALAFCALMDHHINVLSRLPHPDQHLTPSLADFLLDLFLRGVGGASPAEPILHPPPSRPNQQ
jgi:AcrR family transcriptional regulator